MQYVANFIDPVPARSARLRIVNKLLILYKGVAVNVLRIIRYSTVSVCVCVCLLAEYVNIIINYPAKKCIGNFVDNISRGKTGDGDAW